MQYSESVFEELFLAIRGEQTAFRWLMDNDYKELGAFSMAINGQPTAYKWLEDNDFHHFSLIVKASKKHSSSLLALTEMQDKKYACLVGAIHYDNNCKQWLQNKNHYDLIDLALILRNKLNEN